MPATQGLSVHIRWMIRLDMPQVMAIENASFDCPWLEEDFLATLRQRNAIGMIAEADDNVVGYMIYELHTDRISLLNFAVDPYLRLRRIGRQMIEKLKHKTRTHGRNWLIVDVRESNLVMQLFLKSLGFRAESILREHYEDNSEDGYRFQFTV